MSEEDQEFKCTLCGKLQCDVLIATQPDMPPQCFITVHVYKIQTHITLWHAGITS